MPLTDEETEVQRGAGTGPMSQTQQKADLCIPCTRPLLDWCLVPHQVCWGWQSWWSLLRSGGHSGLNPGRVCCLKRSQKASPWGQLACGHTGEGWGVLMLLGEGAWKGLLQTRYPGHLSDSGPYRRPATWRTLYSRDPFGLPVGFSVLKMLSIPRLFYGVFFINKSFKTARGVSYVTFTEFEWELCSSVSKFCVYVWRGSGGHDLTSCHWIFLETFWILCNYTICTWGLFSWQNTWCQLQ